MHLVISPSLRQYGFLWQPAVAGTLGRFQYPPDIFSLGFPKHSSIFTIITNDRDRVQTARNKP